jgi:hypothetical protein
MANPPHQIAHRKGWNTWNTGMINAKIPLIYKDIYTKRNEIQGIIY